MAHPTRTGDVVAFSYPPYQFDAATPGTLIARSAFFGQHGYVPDVQDLKSNTNMRATFLAGGDAIDRGVVHDVRSIDLAPTAAFLLDIPVPQHSQGTVLLDMLDDGHRYTPVPIIGLNDFHGQLDAASATIAGRNTLAGEIAALSVGGAGQLATLFDEEAAHLPGRDAAVGGRRQRRGLTAELGAAERHPGDRRRERCGVSTRPATATTSSTSGSNASSSTTSAPTSRSCRPTSSRRRPGNHRRGRRRRRS